MKWIDKKKPTEKVVFLPDAVRTKPEAQLHVIDPDAASKKKRAKKQMLLPARQIQKKLWGYTVKVGGVYQLTPQAQKLYKFDICTVTKCSILGDTTMVEVLTPDCRFVSLNAKLLRGIVCNDNGNLDDEESDHQLSWMTSQQHNPANEKV